MTKRRSVMTKTRSVMTTPEFVMTTPEFVMTKTQSVMTKPEFVMTTLWKSLSVPMESRTEPSGPFFRHVLYGSEENLLKGDAQLSKRAAMRRSDSEIFHHLV